MPNNNDVVIIDLDRPRQLRFGHKALKAYTALTGKSIDSMGQNGFDLEDIERLMYAGLLSDARKHGETLTVEFVEDLLDEYGNVKDNIAKMTEALQAAFGTPDPNAVEAARKQLAKAKM